jgi:hypothetical protein
MTIFQLEDSRPFLTHSSQPIQWHTGSAPWWVMSSSMVRINKRGVAFKPEWWHTRNALLTLPGWTNERCHPSAFGLCAKTQSSIVFPSIQTPLVNEELDWLCGSTATYRSVANVTRYDISACDVLDAKIDYVLADEVLFTSLSTDLPEWIYWTVCVLVVYLVRCLSKYVLSSLKKSGDGPNPVLCVSACILTCLLVVGQGDFIYATEEELLFHWFTIFYVAAYTLLFTGNRLTIWLLRSAWKDPPFYNLLAGVLLLVASRLYCGAETPYNPPLIFIIAVRVAVKSRRGSDFLRSLTLLLDAFMLSLICILGFNQNSRYLIALFTAALAASDVLVVN